MKQDMKTKKQLFGLSQIILSIMLMVGCSSNYNYWPIEKFNLKSEVIRDKEEIKIIYFSNGPYSKDREFYFQIVVEKVESGDTINILSPINQGISMEDKEVVYNFISNENPAARILDIDVNDLISTGEMSERKESGKTIDKVIRDPQFDFIADNDFPTIIGLIGKIPKENP